MYQQEGSDFCGLFLGYAEVTVSQILKYDKNVYYCNNLGTGAASCTPAVDLTLRETDVTSVILIMSHTSGVAASVSLVVLSV